MPNCPIALGDLFTVNIFFCFILLRLLLHRLAVRISLPFHIFLQNKLAVRVLPSLKTLDNNLGCLLNCTYCTDKIQSVTFLVAVVVVVVCVCVCVCVVFFWGGRGGGSHTKKYCLLTPKYHQRPLSHKKLTVP